MHGVSFRTVEWLYLPVHLCLIHRLHSIPTTLQVSFFGTSQGNSLSHLVLYCTKCFELSSLPTFLFLAFFHNFNLLLLLVSIIPVFQSLHSLHLPGISILFFQNLNSFLLPVISIFLFLNLNYLLPCLLILFQNLYFLSVVFFIVLLILSVTSFLHASTTTFLFLKYSLRSISAKCRKIQLLHTGN